jgi:hypothetical protein
MSGGRSKDMWISESDSKLHLLSENHPSHCPSLILKS